MGVSKIKAKHLIAMLQRSYDPDDYVGFIPKVKPPSREDVSRRNRDEKQKTLGLCRACGKGPLCTKLHCVTCAEKNRVRSMNWYDKNKHKISEQKKQHRAMIAQRVAGMDAPKQ